MCALQLGPLPLEMPCLPLTSLCFGKLFGPFKWCRSHKPQEELFEVRKGFSPEKRSNTIVMLVKEGDFRNGLSKHWEECHVSLSNCTEGWAQRTPLSVNPNWRMAVRTTPYLAEVTNDLGEHMKVFQVKSPFLHFAYCLLSKSLSSAFYLMAHSSILLCFWVQKIILFVADA